MAIIVDANATHLLFNGDQTGGYIYDQIKSGAAIYVTGGKHMKEVLIAGMSRRLFSQLQLAGRLRVYPDHECNSCERDIVANLPLKSDDPHIIALAIRSGCRLLYSFDAALCSDFKNKKVVDSPRGKVIHDKKNAELIRLAPKLS